MLSKTALKARKILSHAIDHIQPRAVGDTQKGIAPNAECLAISTMSQAMVLVVRTGQK